MDKSVTMNHEHIFVCSVAAQWSAQRWKPRYPTSTSTTEPPPSTTTDRAWPWLGQDQDECDHCPGRGCHGVSGGGLLARAGAAVLQCCSVAETSHPTAQGGGPLVILPPGGYVSAALSKLKTSAS